MVNEFTAMSRIGDLTIEEIASHMCIFCETFNYPEYDDKIAMDEFVKSIMVYGNLYG